MGGSAHVPILARGHSTKGKRIARFPFNAFSDSRYVRPQEEGHLLISTFRLGTRNVRLINVHFKDSTGRVRRVSLLQVCVRYTVVTNGLPTASVFRYQGVGLRFQHSLTSCKGSERSNDRHLVKIRGTFLCVSTRENVRTNVFRLILDVIMFNNGLPRSMRNFIIYIKDNCVFLVGDRCTLHFHLSALMFNFHHVRLGLVVYEVGFNGRLSFTRVDAIVRVRALSDSTRPRYRTCILDHFRPSKGLRNDLFIDEGCNVGLRYQLVFCVLRALVT